MSAQGKDHITVSGAPEGFDAKLLVAEAEKAGAVIHIARDDKRLAMMRASLQFFAPDLPVFAFPAWDCLPYDRVSPNPDISAARMATLAALVHEMPQRYILLTTLSAAMQYIPAREVLREAAFKATVGERVNEEALRNFLVRMGFSQSPTVTEPGDYAIRGGIIDIFPPGDGGPVRLDFFGDVLDGVRRFDAATQRTTETLGGVELAPVSEVLLDDASITRFRQNYRLEFGAAGTDDPLYEAVSAGRKHAGIEHWLPFFHERLETLFDYVPNASLTLDEGLEAKREARWDGIVDQYETRKIALGARGRMDSVYKPVPAEQLYLDEPAWAKATAPLRALKLVTLPQPTGAGVIDAGGRIGRNFAPERQLENVNLFSVLKDHIEAKMGEKPVLLASYSEGARERIEGLLDDEGLIGAVTVKDARRIGKRGLHLAVWPLEQGFEAPDMVVIAEQDILGDRLIRAPRRKRTAENFLTEAQSLSAGDLIVHVDHGVGRYHGLEVVTALGAAHECLKLEYAENSTLYLPVENIELLSRYGHEEGLLDRLGGGAWQSKKARLKERIREMADKLIRVAAERALRRAPIMEPMPHAWEEFATRFPYQETDDQLSAIEDVLTDLGSGQPMDRLICGDVGFGKTEVALRAAFIVAMAGYQVALVAPTTLLARQHGKQFAERFAGFPLKLGVLSRMTSPSDARQVKEDLASGDVQVVIGTHALLAKSLSFNNLGLLIVDEEQHFGVGQKERLKEMRGDIHVLTLSATPIPRTLQMALSGVREMSLIATPPVDRLAVRTFVGPWDGVVLREAILRETFRGGQVFVVCPRIDDLQRVYDRVRKLVPDARILSAHGRMPAAELDDVMTKFADGEADILLSTNIVESGIDIPSANTMIIHRADMFGLSQLYQLRGRVGRGRQRAYAYLTSDPNRILTPQARRRLEVMQTLDTLGAGFTLASYDMDIRGAGNLLGDEQSGHVREVGVELYQEMLRQAVDAAKAGDVQDSQDTVVEWTPQINLGLEVRIPEAYVPDLTVRLSLYRRIAGLNDMSEIDAILAELVDRFGAMPDSVRNLFAVIEIKQLCKLSNVDKIDAGPKGLSIGFRDNLFANPEQLVGWIAAQQGRVQLRGDHKLIIKQTLPQASGRAPICKGIVQELVALL